MRPATISDLMSSLGCTKWPERWGEIYDKVMDQYDKYGCDFTDPIFYDKLADRYNVLREYRDYYKEAAVEIGKDEDLARARKELPDASDGYVESIATCRTLCDLASERGIMLLHAATVKVGGKAYAFSAPSGTGKSTHIRLWKKFFGEKVSILNGDKPLVREKDGEIIAYGTPWCGKEGWNKNDKAPLAALCFIERASVPSIRRLSTEEAVSRVFGQLLKPRHEAGVREVLRLTDILLRSVPLYLLSCDISEASARLSFETLTQV